MTIVCGTDFSPHALKALDVAAALAAKLREPLILAHAPELFTPVGFPDGGVAVMQWVEAQREGARKELEGLARRVEGRGIQTQVKMLESPAAASLVALAAAEKSTLLVLASHGRGAAERAIMGSVADRVSRTAQVPVLVVGKGSDDLARAVESGEALSVVLAVNSSHASDVAVEAARAWAGRIPCRFLAVHAYWPPGEAERLGLRGVRNLVTPDPEVVGRLHAELSRRVMSLSSAAPVDWRIVPDQGGPVDRVAEAAHDARAHLIMVGNHQRSGLERVWPGSFSTTLLHRATTSVLSVPATSAALTPPQNLPRYRHVLTGTDFSPAGNAAVFHAYGLAGAQGVVELCYVTHSKDPIWSQERTVLSDGAARKSWLEDRLRKLIPAQAVGLGILTHVHVFEGEDAAQALVQAAERWDVDALVLGSRMRGVTDRLLGSIAEQVTRKSNRPILIIRPPSS